MVSLNLPKNAENASGGGAAYSESVKAELIAAWSIELADALIKELEKQ